MLLAWAGVSFATWALAIALGVYAFNAAGAAAVGIAGSGPSPARRPRLARSGACSATATRVVPC